MQSTEQVDQSERKLIDQLSKHTWVYRAFENEDSLGCLVRDNGKYILSLNGFGRTHLEKLLMIALGTRIKEREDVYQNRKED